MWLFSLFVLFLLGLSESSAELNSNQLPGSFPDKSEEYLTSTFARRLHRRRHIGAPPNKAGAELPPEMWFNQDLDHFHPADTRTWKQRYWINSTFYKPGGPAFLMIGGEGAANAVWMVDGTWIQYAQKFGAICFQVEHRFYGKSHPTEDLSVKNLAYLSSEQALADLANFVTAMNGEHNLTDAKWISFGGSYPGSLSAWFRLKYPHIVHGAVSTSGPLFAKADFFEYLEVVSDALDVTNPKCNPAIQDGMKKADMLTLHRVGWKMISKMFNLCSPFDGTQANDVSNFFMTLIGNFEDIVQYNKDNKAFEGSTHDNVTIETLCDIMTKVSKDSDAAVPVASGLGKDRETIASDFLDNLEYGLEKLSQDVQGLNTAEEISSTIGKFFESTIVKNLQLHQTTTSAPTSSPNAIPMIEENVKAKSNLQRLADVNAFILKMNGEKCLDISYANTVKAMKKEAFYPGEGLGTRQWVYQTCTEFGWYQTSDVPGHPYTMHFPIGFQEEICSDVYGPKYNADLLERGIRRTNYIYGARDIKVTNVVFVHGSIDPWHAMGITKDISDDATAIYIQGTAHCANMYPERDEDLPQLKMARRKIEGLIAQWLNN